MLFRIVKDGPLEGQVHPERLKYIELKLKQSRLPQKLLNYKRQKSTSMEKMDVSEKETRTVMTLVHAKGKNSCEF